MFKQLLKLFTEKFIQRVGRSPQTPSEVMSIQDDVVRYLNKTKGAPEGPKKPPFQGFTPKVIEGGKSKEGIGTLFKDSPEAIAKIKADNKAAVERLRNKKKTVEDFRDDGDFDPSGMASGGMARVGMFMGGFTKAEVLIQILKNTIKGSKDSYVKKNFPNWIKEIQKNPKLALDENVWKELTGGLPKNQRLVVHSDDSVDFFTQSEFGPHNIEKTLEFQKKHNLSRDQANKVLRMEPEDRVLEMKRLETLADRSRTKQASGGRVPMIFGGSAGLKGLIASIKASLNKGRTEKIKTLFPTYSVAEKELLKLGEKYLPKDAATLAAKEIQGKGEGIEILIDRLKHDKKLLERQAKNKAMNDPNLDFMMESLEKTMPEAYGPHLKKYTNIDKDILQLETIKKNLIMKDRKLHASGGRAGTGLNYLLGEDDQNVRTPYQGGLPGLLGE